MKTAELRRLTKEELEDRIKTLDKELFEMNYQRKYGKVEKPHLFRVKKREIARILTLLKELKDGE